MKHVIFALALTACAATEPPNTETATAGAAAQAQSLLAPAPCYTAQINAIKSKLQGPLYYCLSANWTFDVWNLRNNDCGSTAPHYEVWLPASRGNGASTCSFSIRRKPDSNGGFCAWKLGTVSASNQVTITSDVHSCW